MVVPQRDDEARMWPGKTVWERVVSEAVSYQKNCGGKDTVGRRNRITKTLRNKTVWHVWGAM